MYREGRVVWGLAALRVASSLGVALAAGPGLGAVTSTAGALASPCRLGWTRMHRQGAALRLAAGRLALELALALPAGPPPDRLPLNLHWHWQPPSRPALALSLARHCRLTRTDLAPVNETRTVLSGTL